VPGFIDLLGIVLIGTPSSTFDRPSIDGAVAAQAASPPDPDFGTALALGRALFTGYFFPLQLAAVLLFVALIGAIVLSKRRW